MGDRQLSGRAIAFLKSSPKILTPPTDDDSEDGESMTEEPNLSGLRLNESIPVQQADTPTHKPRRRRSIAETQGSKDTAKPFDLTNHPLRHHQIYEQSSYQAERSRLPIERSQNQQRRPEPTHKTFIPTSLHPLSLNPFGPVSAPHPPPMIPLPPLPTSQPSPINPLHALLTTLTTNKLVRSIHARLLLNPDTFGAQILTPLQTLYHPNTHQALHLLNTFPLHEGEKLRALSDRQKRLESQICLSQVLGFLEILKILPAISQGTIFVVAKVEREVGDVLVRMCENDAQERSKEDILAIQEFLKREMEEERQKQEGPVGKDMEGMEGGASSAIMVDENSILTAREEELGVKNSLA